MPVSETRGQDPRGSAQVPGGDWRAYRRERGQGHCGAEEVGRDQAGELRVGWRGERKGVSQDQTPLACARRAPTEERQPAGPRRCVAPPVLDVRLVCVPSAYALG